MEAYIDRRSQRSIARGCPSQEPHLRLRHHSRRPPMAMVEAADHWLGDDRPIAGRLGGWLRQAECSIATRSASQADPGPWYNGLLNRYTGLGLYRGFESPPLRFSLFSGLLWRFLRGRRGVWPARARPAQTPELSTRVHGSPPESAARRQAVRQARERDVARVGVPRGVRGVHNNAVSARPLGADACWLGGSGLGRGHRRLQPASEAGQIGRAHV